MSKELDRQREITKKLTSYLLSKLKVGGHGTHGSEGTSFFDGEGGSSLGSKPRPFKKAASPPKAGVVDCPGMFEAPTKLEGDGAEESPAPCDFACSFNDAKESPLLFPNEKELVLSIVALSPKNPAEFVESRSCLVQERNQREPTSE